MRTLLYKNGTKLRILTENVVESLWNDLEEHNEELSDITLAVGDVITVSESKKWAPDAYMFEYEGYTCDPGYDPRFIESLEKFKPINTKIENWKKELE